MLFTRAVNSYCYTEELMYNKDDGEIAVHHKENQGKVLAVLTCSYKQERKKGVRNLHQAMCLEMLRAYVIGSNMYQPKAVRRVLVGSTW